MTPAMTRSPLNLKSILEDRGYVWKAPVDWSPEMGGSQEAIYDTILSSNAAPLKATYDALTAGTLQLVRKP
jgi:hypothetical protein